MNHRIHDDDRVGQVWEEEWGKKRFMLVIVGVDRGHPLVHAYVALNLDTGALEDVPPRLLDEPNTNWTRVS